MNSLKLGLWVSSLALMALVASCGSQNIGSPIQDDLDAVSAAQEHSASGRKGGNVEFEWKVEEGESLQGQPGLSAGSAEQKVQNARSASFTPGLPVSLVAGFGTPNILRYGWMGGPVTEGAAPNWVKLTTTDKRKPAWIMYRMEEFVVGRLQNIRIIGAGSGMQVHMYNWNTATWTNFGVYNLSMGPANIAVGIPYAPNGVTRLRLSEPGIGSTRIDKIETQVF